MNANETKRTKIRRANLEKAIKMAGSAAKLSRLADIRPSEISQMRNVGHPRNVGDRAAEKIEKALNLQHGWMDYSPIIEGEYTVKEQPKHYIENNIDNNVEDALDPPTKKVPVISWVQAGQAAEVIDNFAPGDAEEWVTPYHQPREHTYALRVSGDSMTPQFHPGMILVVEPTMCAECGDFVIAKNGEEEATFKQYIKDGGKHYLKPLNTQYPVIEMGEYQIIGVVRDAIMKLK